MVLLDDAIGNTICSLEASEIDSNTIVVVASDNGGHVADFPGVSSPYRGGKGAYTEGGVHNTAFLYGPASLIPPVLRGTSYDGLVYISDWFPTLMGLASAGTWTGPSNGHEIDGFDIYNAIITSSPSPRTEIFMNFDVGRQKGAILIGKRKLVYGSLGSQQEPDVIFTLNGTLPYAICFGLPAIVATPGPTASSIDLTASNAPSSSPSGSLTHVPFFTPTSEPTAAHTPPPSAGLTTKSPSVAPVEVPVLPIPSAAPKPLPSASPHEPPTLSSSDRPTLSSSTPTTLSSPPAEKTGPPSSSSPTSSPSPAAGRPTVPTDQLSFGPSVSPTPATQNSSDVEVNADMFTDAAGSPRNSGNKQRLFRQGLFVGHQLRLISVVSIAFIVLAAFWLIVRRGKKGSSDSASEPWSPDERNTGSGLNYF